MAQTSMHQAVLSFLDEALDIEVSRLFLPISHGEF